MTTLRSAYVALGLIVAMSGGAGATVHHVDWSGGGGYLTIQEAADACAEGDTIEIAPGDYHEQITFSTEKLLIVGAGRNQARVLWDGEGPALKGDGIQTQFTHTIRDLSIVRSPDSEDAIKYPAGAVILENTDIVGDIRGDGRFSAIVDNCTLTDISMTGGLRVSSISGSVVGRASVSGESQYGDHSLTSSGSEYGELSLWFARATLEDDLVKQAFVNSGYGYWSGVEATRTEFDQINSTGEVVLSDCIVWGDLDMTDVNLEYCPAAGLDLTDCVIHGSISLPGETEDDVSCIRLLHNTILGSLWLAVPPPEYYPTCYPWEIRSNIVMGQTEIWLDPSFWPVPITHNDFVSGFSISAPGDSVLANLSVDPLFCDLPAGDLALQSCSPCVGVAHDGGDIGRLGVGCECASPVEPVTWGRLKALFR